MRALALFLPAAFADANYIYVGFLNLEVVPLAELFKELANQVALKFLYPPAFGAYQVIVGFFFHQFVMMVLFIQVELSDQTHLLEHAEGAIHGGEAYAGFFLPSPTVNLVGWEVFLALFDYLKYQGPLGRQPFPLSTKGPGNLF